MAATSKKHGGSGSSVSISGNQWRNGIDGSSALIAAWHGSGKRQTSSVASNVAANGIACA